MSFKTAAPVSNLAIYICHDTLDFKRGFWKRDALLFQAVHYQCMQLCAIWVILHLTGGHQPHLVASSWLRKNCLTADLFGSNGAANLTVARIKIFFFNAMPVCAFLCTCPCACGCTCLLSIRSAQRPVFMHASVDLGKSSQRGICIDLPSVRLLFQGPKQVPAVSLAFYCSFCTSTCAKQSGGHAVHPLHNAHGARCAYI